MANKYKITLYDYCGSDIIEAETASKAKYKLWLKSCHEIFDSFRHFLIGIESCSQIETK